MALPDRIVIDGIEWTVIFDRLPEDQFGECRPGVSTIVIAERLSEQLREQTFWHELIHAIRATRDLPTKNYKEERIAQLFGAALYSFFEANADIIWEVHDG